MAFQSMNKVEKKKSKDVGFQLEKLTLDIKNELTLDNKSIGGNSIDELNIQHIITKEAYLGQFSWSESATASTGLFSSVVRPDNYTIVDSSTYAGQYAFSTVPLSYISQLFEYWRGDIIYHFKVICSPYHKGRLRVAWEPAGYGATNLATTDIANAVYSEIFDIGITTDFEVRIPYMQPTEWSKLRFLQGQFNTFGSIGSYVNANSTDNGFLVIRVMNELSAPSASANATVIVSVRAAENLEFAGPSTTWSSWKNLNYSMFVPQSEIGVEKKSTVLGIESKAKPERYLTNHGEGIISLRQYLRRTSYVTSDIVPTSAGNLNIISKMQSRFPQSYGYDTAGLYQAQKVVGTGNAPFNWSTLHPITWIMSMFLGVRGSVQWYFDITDTTSGYITNFKATRSPQVSGTVITSIFTNSATTTNPSILAANFYKYTQSGQAGMAVTDTRVQPVLAIQAPNYSRYFFQGTNKYNTCYPPTWDDQNMDALTVEWSINALSATTTSYSRLDSYASIGTDFNVVFFLCTPIIYGYGSTPVPV